MLQHIVELTSLGTAGTDFHAADVNNSNTIDILDAVGILQHIVELNLMSGFDLVDDLGKRVDSLDPTSNSSLDWTLIANGDVNHSGHFLDLYTIDIV